jgi:1,4-dihydroxy-2-naphthoyl-CoA hydrolase
MTTKTVSFCPELTAEVFNGRSRGHLPGLTGVEILRVSPEGVESRMAMRREVMAPNGFLHAASVIALADTSCGYGCRDPLLGPDRAISLHPDGVVAQVRL